MTKARTLANFISDGSTLADGAISVSEVSGAAPLASPSFTGNLTVDTDTLYVDAGDNQVSVGSSSGYQQLNVNGNIAVGGAGNKGIYFGDNITSSADQEWLLANNASSSNAFTLYEYDSGTYVNTRMVFASGGDTNFYNANNSTFTINQDGLNSDFRVESDNSSYALFVDAGDDTVSVGRTSGAGKLNVRRTSSGTSLFLYNSNNDYPSGSTGYSDIDAGFYDYLTGGDNAGGTARVRFESANAFHSSRSARVLVMASPADGTNTAREMARFQPDMITFNDLTYDQDFRVESNNNSHALFVDAGSNAVHIGGNTDVDDHPLVVHANTNANAIAIRGRSDDIGEISFFENDATTKLGSLQFRNNFARLDHRASGGSVNINVGPALAQIVDHYETGPVFNESGSASIDFRIESDAYSHVMFVDASENRVSIGHNSTAGYGSGHVLSVAGGSTQFSNIGSDVTMMIRGGSYTDPHTASILLSGGYGDNGYVKEWYMSSVTSGGGGAINNDLKFRYLAGGSATQYEALKLRYNGEVIVNDEGYATHDFRVESDNNSNMFVVDAGLDRVQIGTQIFGAGQTVSRGEFISFNTGMTTVSSGGSQTLNMFTRSPDANVAATGTVYISAENSGGSVQVGCIIDFFFSNGTLNTTARETGSSQGTMTFSVQENGNAISVTVGYTSGLGGAIRFNAGGHASIASY